jgi:GNAT superfamily N-acetyltransferase
VIDDLTIARVAASATYPLRHRVLRAGQPPDAVRLPVDDLPDTATFAALDAAGEVVGSAVLMPEPFARQPGRPAWRLRGMATAPEWRGRGVGSQVLRAALDHARARGGEVVWCNARTPARRFYERAGFVAVGDEFEEPLIGPHVVMWHDLTGAPSATS